MVMLPLAPTFNTPQNSTAGIGPATLAVADFNGDGKLDVVVGNQSSNNVSLFLNSSSGFLTATTVTGLAASQPTAMTTGDFNNDGKADLAVLSTDSGTDGKVYIALGNGDGTFRTPTTIAKPSTGGATGIAVGDIDGDGKLDLVTPVANGSTGTVMVYHGNGDGTFGSGTPYSVGANPNGVVLADVNGDGKLDMIVANQSSSLPNGSVSVLLGVGDGTFGTQHPFTVGNQPLLLAVGDLNGDGKADIVAANFGDGTVSVLIGDGSGTTFTPQGSAYSVGSSPWSVAIADVNGDGKPDLIANNSTGASILLGNGDGTFQPTAITITTGASSIFVATADINGDGKPDILIPSQNGNLTVLQNTTTFALSVAAHTTPLSITNGTTQTVTGYSIADAAGTTGTFTVTVTGSHGTVSIPGVLGTVLGDGTASETISGTFAEINIDLAALTFTGTALGSGSISVTASDGTNAATGTTLITVTNDYTPPVSPVTPTPRHSTVPNQLVLTAGSPTPLTVHVGSVIGTTELNLPASGPGTGLDLTNVTFATGGATTPVILFDTTGGANVTLPGTAADNSKAVEFVASSGDNSITGGATAVEIFGSASATSNDTLTAGSGGGTIVGGAGHATIDAGTANDTAFHNTAGGTATTVWGSLAGSTITGGGNFSEIISQGSGTVITASATALNQFFQGDTIGGTTATDTINLSQVAHAQNYVQVGTGHTTITTSASDAIIVGGSGAVTISSANGSSGSLNYIGSTSANESTSIGGNAYTTLFAQAGNGSDTLSASTSGMSTLVGGTGHDTFFGSTGKALIVTQGNNGAHDMLQFADSSTTPAGGTFVVVGANNANDTVQITLLTSTNVSGFLSTHQHFVTLTTDSQAAGYDANVAALLSTQPASITSQIVGQQALQVTLTDGQIIDLVGVSSLLTASNIIGGMSSPPQSPP